MSVLFSHFSLLLTRLWANHKCFARKVTRLFADIRLEEIENEIRAVNKLCKSCHPNIIQVFELGQLRRDSAFYFIDMELCNFTLEKYSRGDDVPSLTNWNSLRNEGKLPETICTIIDNIVDGLIFIHGQKEVHRDLSPQNGTDTTTIELTSESYFLLRHTLGKSGTSD